MRKTVIFDLGGVLIEWDPRRLYRKLLANDDAVEEFLRTVCTPAWNVQQDAGRPLADATAERVQKFPEHEALIRAYYDRWDEMLGGAIQGTVDILRELRDERVPLLGLTNWSAETFPRAERLFDFLHWFDDIVVSGQEKLVKPDPRLFQHLLMRHNLESSNCIFIDDSLVNVRASTTLGFDAIHFEDPTQLRLSLQSRQVLS